MQDDTIKIGKGTVRSQRVSLHTITTLKIQGWLFHIFVHSRAWKNGKTVKTHIERWWGEMQDDTIKIGKGTVRSQRVSLHTITTLKFQGWLFHNFVHSRAWKNGFLHATGSKNAKPLKPILKGGGGNVGGHIYDRQRWSQKLECHSTR